MAQILASAPGAEERLVRAYGRGIAILLDRHTSGRPEREDLFQDVFRLALEKLRGGELREPAKLPGFLAQLARSLAIEHYRKLGRRKTEPAGDSLDAAPAHRPSQERELLERENAALVRRLIRELAHARDREVLFRFYIGEEDRDAIAAELGLSSLQFNRVLHRARQRYKELYLERIGAPRLQPAAAARAWLAILWILTPLCYGMLAREP